MATVSRKSNRRAARVEVDKDGEKRHVLAERFKTAMCKNFVTTGKCPYDVRCMFAHGEEELRTPEMNVRDGLITEEAIKSTQRAKMLTQRRALTAAEYDEEEFDATEEAEHSMDWQMSYPEVHRHTTHVSAVPMFYRHNPYAVNVFQDSSNSMYSQNWQTCVDETDMDADYYEPKMSNVCAMEP